MWTSWRNKSLWLLAAALAVPGLLRAAPSTGGPIVGIGVSPSSPGPFSVNVTTNVAGPTGGNGGIRWQLIASTSTLPPDAGQIVDLQLFDNGTLEPGAMSPAYFTTNGTDTTFGGGSSVIPGSGEVLLTFNRAGTLTIRAIVRASTSVYCNSNPFIVYPSTAAKLLVFVPTEMSFAQSTGTIGTAAAQQPRQPFTVTVVQTDAFNNRVEGFNPTVNLASGDLVTIPTPNLLLAAGQRNFDNITINAAKTTRTFTATGGGLTPGTVNVVTEGPNPEEVFPFPSPFNPREGAITFRFQLNEAKSVRLIVKDRFGQDVWRNDVTGAKGMTDIPWDGRNENGHIVAAGIYIVVLEVDGSIKSKKKFGVSK
jgi:hypothetical protein